MTDPTQRPALEQQVEQFKPRPGAIFLFVPVVAIALTFAAYAVVFGMGLSGRAASGAEVDVQITGCTAGIQVVQARLAEMGLPSEPVVVTGKGQTRIRSRLPFEDSDPGRFAEVLATPGRFEMRDGDEVLATDDDIAYAGVRLDATLTPATLVTLADAGRDRVYARMNGKPEGRTHMFVDGVEVWSFGNRKSTMNGEFEIPPDAANDQARMELAASRGIILNNGPVPCPLEVRAVPR